MGHARPILAWAMFVAVFLSAGCSTTGTAVRPLSVYDVVVLSKAGTPAEDIIKRIQDSGATYNLDAGQIEQLRREGVPDPVLSYMRQAPGRQQQGQTAIRDFDREFRDWDFNRMPGSLQPGIPGWGHSPEDELIQKE